MQNMDIIQSVLSPIAKDYGVKRLYLFGSFAKGTAHEGSDIDILIEKGIPLSLLKLSDMRQRCQEALQCPVDLITTTGISEAFYSEIKGTEVLLYEA